MEDFESLPDEELIRLEKQYTVEYKKFARLAIQCRNVRSRRDAIVMLATANAAKERARTGTCTNGVGDCPVHQMGSCKK